MTLGTVLASISGERRVALVPPVVSALSKKGLEVVVESNAGREAGISDDAFRDAGARIVQETEAWGSDVLALIAPPSDEEIARLASGAVVVGFMQPLDVPERITRLADQGVTALAMELVPRISRAQKMDALSAMASLAGYKATLVAANRLPRFFPLLTTAAGTVRPANVTILGAGVAGLQAIATARRLGARVWGYDIREAAREEVKSLGAQFVELDLEMEDMQDEGGYAKALMAAKAEQQVELLVPHLAKSDVVITTALIPGRRAPTLVSEEAVKAMKPGSVVVDLAAATGGNCVLTEPDRVTTRHGVQIIGYTNLPATVPADASFLYARTISAMIGEFVKDGVFETNFEDDIFKGACVCHEGQVVHERVRNLIDR
ncbi:MAG: Re/Si-specific NAD(P)(+) transhydrogenase subunit alpha [Rhodothermaceae bacterium]|nr:Re/Si-specific NAD(P)(+) transhydrogenase subunit alpha [Rhodothermaceae bacterium]MYF63362.1 Re/Si-specific NAD(P)(+) transhydrogenase subunit alpha [Rhodothermaceae bacterium]MYI83792.1 Re/Si-specific NAD(P)(+) transhydrogenase subunit alpha [Rhodothermaceae bacterium]